MAYAEAEKALATREAYASDWRDFAAWCASRGATALPAHVGIVAAYLSWGERYNTSLLQLEEGPRKVATR